MTLKGRSEGRATAASQRRSAASRPMARAAAPVPVIARQDDNPLDFKASLCTQILAIANRRSGEKTALRLMVEGLTLLGQLGFRDLNIDDVVNAANVAKGTFYIHFPSKDDFLLKLAERYVAFEASTVPGELHGESRFGQMRSWVAWYERIFAVNIGILRALVQMGDINADMRALWHRRNATIVDSAMASYYEREGRADPIVRFAVRIAGGMLDQSLFERLQVHVGPGLREPENDELREELHTLLLFRAVFGRDPPLSELTHSRALTDWSRDRTAHWK